MAEGCPESCPEEERRPAFGGRKLKDESRVLEHNAWCVCVCVCVCVGDVMCECGECRDDVEWGEEQKRAAEERVAENSSEVLPDEEGQQYEVESAGYWDSFYQQHHNR